MVENVHNTYRNLIFSNIYLWNRDYHLTNFLNQKYFPTFSTQRVTPLRTSTYFTQPNLFKTLRLTVSASKLELSFRKSTKPVSFHKDLHDRGQNRTYRKNSPAKWSGRVMQRICIVSRLLFAHGNLTRAYYYA